MEVTKKVWGQFEGKDVYLFKLKNSLGAEIEIIEFGAIIKDIIVPGYDNKMEDIALGYDSLEGYIQDTNYFGATIGRVANRIGGAEALINKKLYKLTPNTLPDFGYHHLHGGEKGLTKVLWKGEEFKNSNEVGVVLKYLSKDGDEGYPGNLNCTVTYSFNNESELKINYQAETDANTLVNLTNHSYFNLAGAGNNDILSQVVSINADRYTATDDDIVPTGEILNIHGKAIDFLNEKSIGSGIDDMEMKRYKGYDLNYIVNHSKMGALDLVAMAKDVKSGRVLEVFSTQSCLQFYSGNFLEGKPGKEGKKYDKYGAFCFEPQGYPDAPNHENFESVELKQNEKYEQVIIYKFSVMK